MLDNDSSSPDGLLPLPGLVRPADGRPHPSATVAASPAYETPLGAAYLGDAADLLRSTQSGSVDLVVTSPPYALEFKKEYGNVAKADYVDWFREFAREIHRVLKESGSFVLNIGGSYNPGVPTRSLYHFRVLLMLCDELGFHLAQECFWYNPAKLPVPAEWVNVRRERIKDSVEYVWWFSKMPHPKANNRNVLVEYSKDMHRLERTGYRPTVRPSGHNITEKFNTRAGGSIPPNVLSDAPVNMLARGNNESNSAYIHACRDGGMQPHPARYPAVLPEFFIQLLTDPGDVVLDPFAGSNTSGSVAQALSRRWLSFELERSYLENSKLRFELGPSVGS